jgi:hypothetical protein
MIAKRTEQFKSRKVIKKPKTKKRKENPKNKIQILIDDVVVQKLISAMGWGGK